MHPPFLVLTWSGNSNDAEPSADLADSLRRAGWRRALGAPQLQIWDRFERPLSITPDLAGDAVILGRWISRRALAPGGIRTPAAAARALCTEGWGSYIALLRAPEPGPWWVFRDPSGSLEGYSWRNNGLGVLASGLADLPLRLLPAHMGIDWSALAEFLFRPEALLARTALDGVEVVCPGDVQPIGAPRDASISVWRPTDHLPTTRAASADWSQPLAETLRETVARLVEPYDRLMIEVSGGFDSSLVAAAVAHSGSASKILAALHYVGDRRESDERRWAEEACTTAGVRIDCVQRSQAPFDPAEQFGELSRDARPIYAAMDGLRDRDTAERLTANGAQAILTGKGGDAIFFSMPSAEVIADLWRNLGWRAIGHPLNAEVARWQRLSVWSLWREAFGKTPAKPALSLAPFAGPSVCIDRTTPPHPWLVGLEAAPPGKRVQVAALVGVQSSIGLSRRGQAADIIQPLLSQPMMELCLAIPTWRLIGAGRDRGLARDTFAVWLPPAVATRRSKSRLTSAYARQLAAGLPAVRDHLLGGVLVDAGLLDGKAIDAALREDVLMQRGAALALVQAAAVESWVRYWQTRIPDAAHAPRSRPA